MMFVIPEAKHARAARGGRRRAVQREGSDRPREEAVRRGHSPLAASLAAAAAPLAEIRAGHRGRLPVRPARPLASCSAGLRPGPSRLVPDDGAMLISLVNTGTILSWRLPEDVPLWAGVLILLVGYQIVSRRFARRNTGPWRSQAGGPAQWFAFWNAVSGWSGLAFVVWIASDHVAEIREFLQRLPDLARASPMRFAISSRGDSAEACEVRDKRRTSLSVRGSGGRVRRFGVQGRVRGSGFRVEFGGRSRSERRREQAVDVLRLRT